MVLESLIGLKRAEETPIYMLVNGFIFATVAVFLANWIFKAQTSLVMVFLTVLASFHIVYSATRLEEKKDFVKPREDFFREHKSIIYLMLFLFLGFTIAFTFWYVILPTNFVNDVFKIQADTIHSINNNVSGNSVSDLTFFSIILANNIKVLFFCILFSFFYGAGAIFILAWNASVIAAAMGSLIKSKLAALAGLAGAVNLSHYFQAVGIGLLRYFIHGIPEILAYLIGGIAGGIISFAVVNHHLDIKHAKRIIIDTLDLIIFAVVILFLAAFLEVYVTPILV